MGNHTKHLTEEEITWAIVDKDELPQRAKEHLMQCQICSKKVEDFASSLGKIGKLATQSVHVPPPRGVFQRNKSEQRSIILPWRHLGLSAALVGMLLVIVFGGFQIMQFREHKRIAAMWQEIERDMVLMAEVGRLIENPLPQVYEEISNEDVSCLGAQFMDFVIPDAGSQQSKQPSDIKGLV